MNGSANRIWRVQRAMTKENRIMNRMNEHLAHYQANYKNDWVGIFLQGSQNYGLDYENSDIDTKIIVLPSFEDIILNKQPISTTSVLPNDEHLDVKDIRLMFDCFKKQNINFLEILFTKYCILNPAYEDLFRPIYEHQEDIAHYNNYAAIHCMLGMVNEKRKALTKPHPSVMDVMEKYGYDGKQLHHMERILEFFGRYINGVPYAECLISKDRDRLISLKKHTLNVDEAVSRADKVVDQMEDMVARYRLNHDIRIDTSIDVLFKSVLTDIMKRSISSELQDAK